MMLARTLVHYGLHFVFPLVIAALWPRRRWQVVYMLLLSTMLIDIDHIYVVMLFLPYARWEWPWWLRVLAVGLTFHIFTDWQDFYLWPH